MKLQGVSVNLVRNEYEYNKYVTPKFRKDNDYNSQKATMPWIVIDFNKLNGDGSLAGCKLKLTPQADFSGISAAPSGELAATDGNHALTIDLDKIKKQLTLQVKNDCKYTATPLTLEVTVEDPLGDAFTAGYSKPNISDAPDLLPIIDSLLVQGSACDSFLGQVIYEIVAQHQSGDSYVHPTTPGNKHIPTGGSSGQILGWQANGEAKWQAAPATPGNATKAKAGLVKQAAAVADASGDAEAKLNALLASLRAAGILAAS